MAAAFSSGILSWSASTERMVETKSWVLLQEPKKAAAAERTDLHSPKLPKQKGKEAWHHEESERLPCIIRPRQV